MPETPDLDPESLHGIRETHRQNLAHLLGQAAKFGSLNVPLPLANQIRDEETALRAINQRLGIDEAIDIRAALGDSRPADATHGRGTSTMQHIRGPVIALTLVAVVAGVVALLLTRSPDVINYRGVVRDSSGQAIANVRVQLEIPNVPSVAFTDSDGIYSFAFDPDVLPQQGTVNVSQEGYQSYRRNIVLTANQTTIEDIRLVRASAVGEGGAEPASAEAEGATPATATPPAPDAASALVIDARIECNLLQGCYQLKPEGWSPQIPQSAATGAGIDPAMFTELTQKYGEKTFVIFPFTEQIPREVAPSMSTQLPIHACIPGSNINLRMSLHNNGTKQLVIERDPVLSIEAIEPYTGPVHAFFYEAEGGVPLRFYEAAVQPMLAGDPIPVKPIGEAAGLGAYTLAPDETEELSIGLECKAPGAYRIRPGMRLRDTQTTVWDFDGVNLNSPEQFYDWRYSVDVGQLGVLRGLSTYDATKGTWSLTSKPTLESWIEP